MYNEKIQLHIYKYENNTFSQIAIIDDYSEISFERNLYQAGQFTITINHNLPNASKFEKGLFIQFGSDPYDFGEIRSISDSIGSDGKGSQNKIISGFDCRYLYKRRIIKNLNNNDTWQMTAKGEICLRSLIYSEAGEGAEVKRRLPITNTIPTSQNAIGKEYSVSEAYTNLYDVLVTIATQSEIGWRVKFENNSLSLECYQGEDKHTTVQFSTDFETLSNGTFTDTNENFSNAVYVGGKGDGSERDIYEGENAINNSSPSGFDRFECWDNQSEMNTEDEYSKEALSMLTQYGQTLTVNGNGLAKSIYVYKEQYNVGDIISISFSGRKANVQILSVTEHWTGRGNYGITFSFGKPVNNLADQIKLLLNKIQIASSKANTIDSVKWYEFSNANLTQDKKDVTFNSIGFTGSLTANRTFTFYLDDEGTGSKIYNIYAKNLSGNFNVTLTTGKSGATNAVIKGGVNLVARVYIDVSGNVVLQSMSATDTIESGNNQPATSNGVAAAMAYDFAYYPGQQEQTVFIIKVPYVNSSHSAAREGCIIINSRYGYRYMLDYYIYINEASLSSTADRIARLRMLDGVYTSGVNYLETKLKWDVDTSNKKILFYIKKNSTSNKLTFKVLDNYLKIDEIEFSTTTDATVWDNAQYSSDLEYLSPINSIESGNLRPATSNSVALNTPRRFRISSPAGQTKYFMLKNNSYSKVNNVYFGNRYSLSFFIIGLNSVYSRIIRLVPADVWYGLHRCKIGTITENNTSKGVFLFEFSGYNPLTITCFDSINVSDYTLTEITESEYNSYTSETLSNMTEYSDIRNSPTVYPTNNITKNSLNLAQSGAVFAALRKAHFKTAAVNASVDANGNVSLSQSASSILPISFIPSNPGNNIINWRFARWDDILYLVVNRTSGTITGTLYYVDL